MQYGLLKYDEWNDLFWLYNSINSPVRTSLTGSLIGINREDESIKYTHFLSKDRSPYSISHDYDPNCGCFENSINSLGVYEESLLIGKPKDLFVVSKNGDRILNVLTSSAQYDLTSGGTSHICCALFPCTLGNSRIVLSTKSDELYFVDAFTGQVKSKLSAVNEKSRVNYTDKISTIADFMSNQSNSTCCHSYHLDYSNVSTTDFDLYRGDTNNSNISVATQQGENTNVQNGTKKETSSFEKIAQKYGSVDSIPEFVPSGYSQANLGDHLKGFGSTGNLQGYAVKNNLKSFQSTHNLSYEGFGAKNVGGGSSYVDRTIGSMTLECILTELKSSRTLHNEFVDSTCVGMTSGLLHIVDNRSNKIVSTISSHNNPVYSISASNNTIATTSCTLYSYQNSYGYQYNNPYSYNSSMASWRLFEPVVYLHDIRMMRSSSLVLMSPVSKVCTVPKSDRLFALSPNGEIFDVTISTMAYKRHPSEVTGGSVFYDLEMTVDSDGQGLDVFTSDSTYSVTKLRLDNKLCPNLDYNSMKLPKNLQQIPINESKEYNNTPFASLMGTFDGDVAHIFVQMFFFLPKLPSIKYHICELSQCITCQIGFGLHNLQVYFENSLKTMEKDVRNSRNFEVKKYSNNVMYSTQLQELMLVENEPSLRTPLFLLLWLIQKVNNELHNYSNKNKLKVTTSLMRDLFSFSKKTTTQCTRMDHMNTLSTDDNYHVPYDHVVSDDTQGSEAEAGSTTTNPFSPPTPKPTLHKTVGEEYCKDCYRSVECNLLVEYTSSPNLLIVDYTASKVERLEPTLSFCGCTYTLLTFYFTFPLKGLYHRSLAYIRLPTKYQINQNSWILVNDGIVMYADESEDEIFDFTKNWKIPIFAIYAKESDPVPRTGRRQGRKTLENIEEIVPSVNQAENLLYLMGRVVPLPYPSQKIPIPPRIFFYEDNIAHNPLAHNKVQTFTPLSLDELNFLQNASFMLALDIEYIKSSLRSAPAHAAPAAPSATLGSKHSFIVSEDEDKYLYRLARVTAIRGNDNLYGVPFLDHYVLNDKPPKDYMTRFSGIHSGDLELKSSVHWLTTQKMIYLKLRYLIDNGCKVVGHGLEQDFRILNLCVPHENVIDTVELFWIPGRRYMSLQFLAFYLLNEKIQQGEHDSIEDAKTALRLYKLYINFKLNNKLKDVIEQLYEIGYKTKWTLK